MQSFLNLHLPHFARAHWLVYFAPRTSMWMTTAPSRAAYLMVLLADSRRWV